MSRFVLRPTRVLLTRLSPEKDQDPVEYTFEEMVANFVPSGDLNEAKKLGFIRAGWFLGLVKSSRIPGKQVLFVLHNADNTGDIANVLKADPSFTDRLICSYRVDEAEFDGKIMEMASETHA